MPDTNKPPTLVAIGEGNVNKPTNTPDTEEKIKQIVEKVRYVEFLHGVPVELPNRTKELLRSSIREAISSRDTYWKEREAKKDDLLDDMWGLICNVNGGIVEDEKPDWYEAFFRIREKYFKQITPINEDNLK